IKKPWASDLDIEIFGFLLKHTNEIYDGELYLKGNNMELFHFLSCGPEVINIAQIKIQDNVNELEELIIKKKFIPFPLRPYHINMSDEEYPAKDGYKNNRQLNIIAQSILIHKNLVNVWKKIGYHEIVDDVNDLVFQSLLLLLFPPAPSSQTIEQTIEPKTEQVIQQLQEFIGLGICLMQTLDSDLNVEQSLKVQNFIYSLLPKDKETEFVNA
ncbi:7743_t:CDS:2, partial [Gigaspora margarita]